jgi:gluconate 2-dehydrogenase gamma chain
MRDQESGIMGQGDEGPVQISRRDALKGMGAVLPMAGAFTFLPPGADRAAAFIASLGEQGQQAQPYRPRFFSPPEWQLVRVLVDYIIPRDERSGSATDAKVPEYMDFILMDDVLTPEANRVSFHGGLGWMDLESRRRFQKGFLQATDAERRQILDDIAYPRRAKPEHATGTAFFSRLRDMTASGFFSSQMGWRDLQYMGNVANPKWDGCPPAANAKLGVTQDLMTTRVKPERG